MVSINGQSRHNSSHSCSGLDPGRYQVNARGIHDTYSHFNVYISFFQVMETSRKVILLQMTSLIMSRMMTQSEMMATHGHTTLNKRLSSDTRRSRDISNHVDHDGRFRGFGGLRRGRDKTLGLGGGGQRPRLEVPEGFDLSTAERQEDGQFCVYKKLSLEGKMQFMNTQLSHVAWHVMFLHV